MVHIPSKQRPPVVRPDASVHFVLSPAYLDRLADYELHLGHVRAAERLANLAAVMREMRAGAEVSQ